MSKNRKKSVTYNSCCCDVYGVISFGSNRLSGKCPYISAQTNINSKTFRLPKISSCGLDVFIARSYQKYDCLRKVKKGVFCLCMNWKLCDSGQTTGKQRVSKILRNTWKKRYNKKWKRSPSVYAWIGKVRFLIKVSLNREPQKSPKTRFSILHCWGAFQNLIAGSLT